MKLEFQPLGDTGIRISFGNSISKDINQSIRMFANYLKDEQIRGIKEWIPTYTSLSVFYDPFLIRYDEIKEVLHHLVEKVEDMELLPATVIEIPTYYGGETGPDLAYVAEYNQLTEDEVISIHSKGEYLIYMMGFVPGFPYLGGMSKKIATPRLQKPRARIKSGAVGIAGQQTGIYPLETPGGWQIIGSTPIRLYEPTSHQPILLTAGDYLQFVPVTYPEYREIQEAINHNQYTVKTYSKDGVKGRDKKTCIL